MCPTALLFDTYNILWCPLVAIVGATSPSGSDIAMHDAIDICLHERRIWLARLSPGCAGLHAGQRVQLHFMCSAAQQEERKRRRKTAKVRWRERSRWLAGRWARAREPGGPGIPGNVGDISGRLDASWTSSDPKAAAGRQAGAVSQSDAASDRDNRSVRNIP